ncbi:unnamed protein product [Leuciscus chuanchicus]
MESSSLRMRMAVCALLLCLLTGARANESEPEIEVELDTRAIRDFYPKDPNLTSEKQLLGALQEVLEKLQTKRIPPWEKKFGQVPMCDLGEQCAIRKGSRIGKMQVNSAWFRLVSAAALPVLTLQTGQVAAVVMEITAGLASAPGVVSMEIPPRGRGALAAVEEDEDREQFQHPRRRGPTSRQGNFYMLIVIGEIATEHQLHAARQHIERGIRSWDINVSECDLDQQLQLFITRHSAQFSAEPELLQPSCSAREPKSASLTHSPAPPTHTAVTALLNTHQSRDTRRTVKVARISIRLPRLRSSMRCGDWRDFYAVSQWPGQRVLRCELLQTVCDTLLIETVTSWRVRILI